MAGSMSVEKRAQRNGAKVMKFIAFFRVFTIAALVISGGFELWSSELFSTPIEQIGLSAIGGFSAAVLAKAAHIV